MKTSELTGAALDWAVAKCEGLLEPREMYGKMVPPVVLDMEYWSNGEPIVRLNPCPDVYYRAEYDPSTNWAQGGTIIERERFGVWFSEAVHDENGKVLREACWYCETSCTTDNGDEPYKCDTGTTPLEAAMRCYVASKLGDEVDLPPNL